MKVITQHGRMRQDQLRTGKPRSREPTKPRSRATTKAGLRWSKNRKTEKETFTESFRQESPPHDVMRKATRAKRFTNSLNKTGGERGHPPLHFMHAMKDERQGKACQSLSRRVGCIYEQPLANSQCLLECNCKLSAPGQTTKDIDPLPQGGGNVRYWIGTTRVGSEGGFTSAPVPRTHRPPLLPGSVACWWGRLFGSIQSAGPRYPRVRRARGLRSYRAG